MSTAFDIATAFVAEKEGGLVSDPTDPGGTTNFGISKRAYPDLDIENLTFDQAKQIWKEGYWDKISGDLLPPRLAIVLFDFAIHSGTYKSVSTLQKWIGAKPDGRMGPQTLDALSKALKIRSEKDLILSILLDRQRLLINIIKDRGTYHILAGWMARLLTLIMCVWSSEDKLNTIIN